MRGFIASGSIALIHTLANVAIASSTPVGGTATAGPASTAPLPIGTALDAEALAARERQRTLLHFDPAIASSESIYIATTTCTPIIGPSEDGPTDLTNIQGFDCAFNAEHAIKGSPIPLSVYSPPPGVSADSRFGPITNGGTYFVFMSGRGDVTYGVNGRPFLFEISEDPPLTKTLRGEVVLRPLGTTVLAGATTGTLEALSFTTALQRERAATLQHRARTLTATIEQRGATPSELTTYVASRAQHLTNQGHSATGEDTVGAAPPAHRGR